MNKYLEKIASAMSFSIGDIKPTKFSPESIKKYKKRETIHGGVIGGLMGAAGGAAASELAELRKTKHIGGAIGGGAALGAAGLAAYARHKSGKGMHDWNKKVDAYEKTKPTTNK
jgi:hypothetical protein